MPSTVGRQKTEAATCHSAAQLQMDCVAAYAAAAEALQHGPGQGFDKMAHQCRAHTEALQQRLQALQAPPAAAHRLTQRLNAGKVALASFGGQRAIAWVVRNNGYDRRSAFATVAQKNFSQQTTELALEMGRQAEQDIAWVQGLLHGRCG